MSDIDKSYIEALETELRFAIARGSDRVDSIVAEIQRAGGRVADKPPVRKATSAKNRKEQRG